MLKFYATLRGALDTLKEDVDGASLVEQGLVVALVAVVLIVVLVPIGNEIENAFRVIRGVFAPQVSPT